MDTKQEYQTLRLYKRTIPKLRLIAAMVGKPIIAVIDEWATAKLAELKAQDKGEKK